MMNISTNRVCQLCIKIIYGTKQSRAQTTPNLFKNPHLTPRGFDYKQPKSYDYDLREDLPNRHLYWNKTEQNRLSRKRYHTHRLYKLKINPIHDSEGKRQYTREIDEIVYELTSIDLIKASLGRTMTNIHEFITRFPKQAMGEVTGGKFQKGEHADVLKFALYQVHDRHLATMNFYYFSTYCQLRAMARYKPTESLLIHFYRHVDGMRQAENNKIPVDRLAKMIRYIFSKKYPESLDKFMYKQERQIILFEDTPPVQRSFEEIVPFIYTEDYLKGINSRFEREEVESMCKELAKLPGGDRLVSRILK